MSEPGPLFPPPLPRLPTSSLADTLCFLVTEPSPHLQLMRRCATAYERWEADETAFSEHLSLKCFSIASTFGSGTLGQCLIMQRVKLTLRESQPCKTGKLFLCLANRPTDHLQNEKGVFLLLQVEQRKDICPPIGGLQFKMVYISKSGSLFFLFSFFLVLKYKFYRFLVHSIYFCTL